jgi:uncharacterized protein (DUF488 family)
MREMMTVGHSNRSFEEFAELLQAHGVHLVADVRTMPRSRHNPQFNRETLPSELAKIGVEYRHVPLLGGLRRARPESINTGWRNLSFRGYADYLQTADFEAGLSELLALSAAKRTAVMCAEAVPWQCHRSLIGDVLTARGVEVRDILTAAKAEPHRMTPFARVEDGKVTYPGSQADLFSPDSSG